MSMASEFRTFIARGNVVDLAVGVIIGAAFGKIVTSLVNDVIMPPIGLATGRVDFSSLKVVLQPARRSRISASRVSCGVGPTGVSGAAASRRWTLLTMRTSMKTTKAMMRNWISVLRKAP